MMAINDFAILCESKNGRIFPDNYLNKSKLVKQKMT